MNENLTGIELLSCIVLIRRPSCFSKCQKKVISNADNILELQSKTVEVMAVQHVWIALYYISCPVTKFPGIPVSLERNTEVFRHHFL